MPELSNNFLRGKMNKDLDDRIVPRGEYRDALNIEVSTSESSDVGTVQNLKGNKNIVSNVLKPIDNFNVYNTTSHSTSIITNINAVVSGNAGLTNLTSSVFDQIKVEEWQDGYLANSAVAFFSFTTTPLQVDNYYNVSFDINVDLTKYEDGEYTYTVGVPNEPNLQFSDTITVENKNLVANSDTSVGVISKTVSGVIYAQNTSLSISFSSTFAGTADNISVSEQSVLVSDTSNAITVGSKKDTATDTIYNFIHKASGLKTQNFTNSQGVSFNRDLGIVSDAIVSHRPKESTDAAISDVVLTDVYKVRVAPIRLPNGKLPMVSILGDVELTSITGLPFITNEYGDKEIQGIRVGMKVSCINKDNIDLWAGQDIRVTNAYFDNATGFGRVNITKLNPLVAGQPVSDILYDNSAIEENTVLEFTSDRLLNFSTGSSESELNTDGKKFSNTPFETNITAINILENFIYFTDGRNEPKKINIKVFKESTRNVFTHTYITELNTSNPKKYYAEQKHITVIKAKPTSPPTLILNGKSRLSTGYITISPVPGQVVVFDGSSPLTPEAHYVSQTVSLINGSNNTEPLSFLKENDTIIGSNTEVTIYSTVSRVNWKEGDNIELTGVSNFKKVTVRIKKALPNNAQFNEFKVNVVSAEDTYELNGYNPESWIGRLEAPKPLYEKNFISFAIRYKYDNNEYSAISPYSQVAFVPSAYSFNADIGFNASMENSLRSLEVIDFVPSDIQEDVKSVDIIIKDHLTTNCYIVKTIEKDSTEWNTSTHGKHKGKVDIKSELRGATMPSLQLSRIFDAVPVKAKAQEIIASRLMYGNYTEGYDMLDDNGSEINFSMVSDFQNLSNVGEEIGTGFSSNDLSANCTPFFDENESSRDYMHNYFRSNAEASPSVLGATYTTTHSSGQTINCAEDIDEEFNAGYPGNGPSYAKVLIPIRPKDESSNNTNLMPGLQDFAETSNNSGNSGNYQDFSTSESEFASGIKPFLYKVAIAGEHIIEVNTKADARYFYGPSLGEDVGFLWPSPPTAFTAPYFTAADKVQLFRSRPSRLELHKVDNAGVSQGIIKNALDLLNQDQSTIDFSKYGSYAASSMRDVTSYDGPNFRISKGAEPLERHRLSIHDETTSIPNHHLKRKITFTQDEVDAGYYIGVFYVYQTSFSFNSQYTEIIPTQHFYDNDGNQVLNSLTNPNPNQDAHVRFLIDSTATSMDIQAPLLTNGLEVYNPTKSVRSNRPYEVGVTYLDYYGRESTVMISEDSNFEITKGFSDKRNIITASIKSKAPSWATHYKYYIKESSQIAYNLVLHKAYPNDDDATYFWLAFNSNDYNKINVDDYLIAKKMHGNNKAVSSDLARYRVLDIKEEIPSSVSVDGITTPLEITASEGSGKFFVKIERLAITPHLVDVSSNEDLITYLAASSNSSLGAVFEVEPRSTSSKGLFWETSRAYPIKLDNNTVHQYITPGDKVEIDSMYDSVTGESISSVFADEWNSTNTDVRVQVVNGAFSFPTNNILQAQESQYNSCIISTSSNLSNFQASLGSNHAVLRFIKKDGSFVTATMIWTHSNLISIVPYTHPTSKTSTVVFNKIGLPWFNCFQWFNGVESDVVGDVFNANTLFPYTQETKQSGFNASDYYPDYGQDIKRSNIIYSQLFNDSSNVDRTNEFILADSITKVLNSSHGQINSLISRNNDILAFCEDKVLKILSSGKDALFNADGSALQIASNRVLGQSLPFVGDFGCQHPESICVDEYRVYFVDKARGAVLRLSRDGITNVSEKGMNSWFNDHLENARAVVASLDDKKSEYNVTIHDVVSPGSTKNVYTVSYDESTKGWTSFKSFIQESGLSLNNKYYTFKNGEMYLHHSDESLRNNFYGRQYNSSVTSLVNMEPTTAKSFSVINYEGSQAEIVKNTTDGRYDNIKAKSGWSVEVIKTDQQEGVVEEFIEKEGKWYNNIKGKK